MESVSAIRIRIEAIAEAAERLWPGRAAEHIRQECVRLADLSQLVDCEELAAEVRELRAAEGFPGSLRAWTWFDDRLFTLAARLDCTPAVARSTVAGRGMIREGV